MHVENPVLLIIDVQKGLDEPCWGRRCNPFAEQNMARILEHWRAQKMPVVHVQHLSTNPVSPLRPGLPGNAIKTEVMPVEGEKIFQKEVNSAFIGTGLTDYLKTHGYNKLVIIGLTTNHCISASARMAGNLGFETTVVSDATAAFDLKGIDGRLHDAETVHAISLASLNEEFASIHDTEEILFQYVKNEKLAKNVTADEG